MIELYFAPTPNGWKVSIMLEECGLPYTLMPVDLGAGDQFTPEFMSISPNSRMPAIVDRSDEGNPVSLFESGAILLYLARKTGLFLPPDERGFYEVMQWLFWQVGGLGPMAGQASHFVNYMPDSNDYSRQRYLNEYDRLLGVMNRRLADREFLTGDYSIADIASFPWLLPYKRYGQEIDKFPHLRRWFDSIKVRAAVRRGVDAGKEFRSQPGQMSDRARKVLFGQTSVLPEATLASGDSDD